MEHKMEVQTNTDMESLGSALLKEKEAAWMPICLIVLGMAGSGKTTFVHVNELNENIC
jgi:GTPase SAR1 family protein